MKSMLIAAVLVGAAIAGLVIYNRQKNDSANRIEDAVEDAYDSMNEAIGAVKRPMHHAMG